ncbi:MAG: hypothetical protein ACTTJH_06140 [Bacteroidales bacterium]
MRKLRLIIYFLLFTIVFCVNAHTQRGFFDFNIGYNKFTQHFDKPILFNTNIDLNVNPLLSLKIEDLKVSEVEMSLLNVSFGYNFHIEKGCYIGFYIGYSQYGGNWVKGINYLSFSPHITCIIPLTKHIFYTPNCFASVGYCMSSIIDIDTIHIGTFTLDITGQQAPKYNFRFAINPFSFDCRLSQMASISFTVLTPMLNVMKFSYKNKDYDQTTKDIVFLYGQLGVKFYVNNKNIVAQSGKGKKRRR